MEEQGTMKFHITLNDEDFIACLICHYLNNPVNKPNFMMGFWKSTAISMAVILGLYLFMEYNTLTLVAILAAFLLFDAALLIYNVVSYPNNVRKNMKIYIENMKNEGKLPYEPDCTVEFLEDEIRETSPSGVRSKKYSDIPRILRDDEHIFVMFGAMEAGMLPLRCLEGKENELVEFLNGKLQKNGIHPDIQ